MNDGIPDTLSWKLYKKRMSKPVDDNEMRLDLSNIGINKKFYFNTIKGDKGLSKQLRVFGFREPLNWKTYYDYVDWFLRHRSKHRILLKCFNNHSLL